MEDNPVVSEETMKEITKKKMEDEVIYDDLVLVSIDVVDSPVEGNDKRVTFSDLTVSRKDDDDAVFLHNIRELKRDDGKGWDTIVYYEADKLTHDEALTIITASNRQALFVVHGFSIQPSFHLHDTLNATKRNTLTKNYIIPVIWPATGQEGGGPLSSYFNERENSKTAGRALKRIKHPVQGFNASIVCHSMGNHVLRYMADEDFNFNNIFMVAADVDNHIFSKKYISKGDEFHTHGLKIKSMLKNGSTGKIHVLHNAKDIKLRQSKYLHLKHRLGATGANLEDSWIYDSVHEDLKDTIVNVDVALHGMLYEKTYDHNYHYYDNTIKYYEENA